LTSQPKENLQTTDIFFNISLPKHELFVQTVVFDRKNEKEKEKKVFERQIGSLLCETMRQAVKLIYFLCNFSLSSVCLQMRNRIFRGFWRKSTHFFLSQIGKANYVHTLQPDILQKPFLFVNNNYRIYKSVLCSIRPITAYQVL
jgi:hypothetical protein